MCEAALRTHRPALSARPFIRAEYLPSAREKAYARRRNRFSLRELLLALGAALFGAGFENGGAQLWAADYGTSFAAWVLCTAFGAIVFMFALILL
jgi:ferric-dicitrate binding protein FerR (iron transport regulator)